MIEIIFSVCLIEDPARCREERVTVMQAHMSPRMCMMVGQVEIARWMDGHPKFQLQKWSCRRAGQIAKI